MPKEDKEDVFWNYLIWFWVVAMLVSLAVSFMTQSVYQPPPAPVVVYDCPAQK